MMTATLTIGALAGCGAAEDDRAGTIDRPTAGATGGQPSSAGQVRDALLTVADLPTGWTAEPDDGSAADKDPSGQYAECPKFAAVVKKAAGLEQVDAEFTSPAGTSLDETIMRSDEAAARDLIAGYAEGVASCPKLTGTTDGVAFDMDLTALSFPKLADETFAHRVSAKVTGTSVTMDMVLVRRGPVVITIVHSAPGPIDTTVTEDITRRALARADKALG